MADPGCSSSTDTDERNAPPPPVYQCNDGKDNDGDGLIDMADPGCSSKTDNDEYNAPANHAPVVAAVFAPVSTPEDNPTAVAGVSSHFSDPDGDALSYSVLGFTNVIASISGNNINISAPLNYNGAETGSVKACDPKNACVSTPLGVTFTPVNDAPYIVSIFSPVSANEDTPTAAANISSHFADVDNPVLNYSVLGFTNISAVLGGNTINISAPLNWNGTETGSVKACDSGSLCVSTPLQIAYTAVNDAPVVDLIKITTANELYPLAGYITYHDVDSSTITCSKVSSTLPQLLVAADGTIYSAGNLDRNIAGNYSVTVSCSDGFLNSTKTTTFDVKDVTAPATISSLAPTATTGNVEQIELNWLSPGDDGMAGAPSLFLIKYALNNPILTEADWSNAPDLASVPNAGSAGSGYSMVFAVPAGYLCFAIKAYDEANNASGVSNSPCADVISRAQWFVDFWLPTSVFYLHGEAWPLMNGDTVDGITGKALELGTILATVTPPPFNTPEAMRDYLLLVTDDVYAPTPPPGNFELCGVNSSISFTDTINRITLETRTPGNDNCNPGASDSYNGLTDQQMQDFRNITRNFLIEYVDAHPADFGNLDIAHNPGWNTYPFP
jgi:hypothetical protein